MNKKRVIKIAKWFFGTIASFFLIITLLLAIFKDDIIQLVVDEVNTHLKAKVSVSKVDLSFWSTFPNLSVDFNNVFIQDPTTNSSKHDTLLFSEKISLQLNPMDIWRENYTIKKIEIQPGTLQLKVNELGEVNYDIFKESESATQETVNFDLKDVEINGLRFSFHNLLTQQHYATDIHEMALQGKFSEQIFNLHSASKLTVKQAQSGELNFISNKNASFDLTIEVNQNIGTFKIPKATILVENLPFELQGIVSKDSLEFNLNAKKLSLTEVAKNFSMSQLNHVKSYAGSGTVDFDLNIAGQVKAEQPVTINCVFSILNGHLTEPTKKQKISNLSLLGEYSNQGGKSKEHLSLRNISFNTTSGPFKGNLKITEFDAPRLRGDVNGNLNLAVVQSLFNIPSIDNMSGNLGAIANFDIKAFMKPSTPTIYDIRKCEGNVHFRDVSFQLIDDKRLFHNIRGDVYLKNDVATIDNLAVYLSQSDLMLNGKFSNVVKYFKGEDRLHADVNIYSKKIAIEDLGTTAKEEQLTEARTYMFPDKISGSVSMNIKNLSYEKHSFQQIESLLKINDRLLNFQSLKFSNSGATISGSLKIEERTPEIFHTTTNLASANINIRSVMKHWNDFDQQVITSNQISGTAEARLSLEAPFDLRGGIIFGGINSQIYLKVENGRLTNVDLFKTIIKSLKTPAAKLAIGSENIKILDQKLADLKFETFENTFIIRQSKIEVPMMKIRSSALNIETNGTHTFDNIIDYHFAFRFRDLKQAKTSEFGTIIDDGTGMNVYLKMYGPLDNPTIEWDKTASKADRHEYNEQEKQNLKGMLKSDFGLFSKDSTVKTFTEKPKQRETIEVQYGEDEDLNQTEKKEKKGSKFREWIEQENKQKQKVEIEFD